ncbi:MAG TPA: type IV secretory system conjugative DNA transfer family protein [Acidimicrobiales bacterium]|nr:type IV secretory system conjugative DNA transfer family protein [Acidimicrobiales bacterium]
MAVVPGAAASAAVVTVALVGAVLVHGVRSGPWRTAGGGGRGRAAGARWATRADVAPLAARGPGRIRLGTACGGARPPRALWTERAQSVAVIGPTQSGKTTGVAVPAILGWHGPVVAASVKTDLLADTEGWRRSLGTVWCFDPAGAGGRPVSGWSPLPAARTWADLTEVARSPATTADGDFWYATAAKLLAPLLFAAATGGATMDDVARWVDTQEVTEVLGLLESAGVEEAMWAARATWQRDDRQRSSVYTTAETVLEPLVGGTAGSGGGPEIDAVGLLEGSHTLYLCAPAHDQRRLRGVFVAVVKQALEAAFTKAARSGPLDPPLLVVLDEAANIAPVAELDGLAATCAGHGIQLVTVWQDLAQMMARYGPRAPTVLNNHRARLFLSGIADPSTLEHASMLVGEEEVSVGSLTRDGRGGRSTTTSTHRRRLLPPEALRQLPQGTGVLIYGERSPIRLHLVPWWRDPELAARGRMPGA